jgi:hypothetical protein
MGERLPHGNALRRNLAEIWHQVPGTHACSHMHLAEIDSGRYTYNSGTWSLRRVFSNPGLFKFAPTASRTQDLGATKALVTSRLKIRLQQ